MNHISELICELTGAAGCELGDPIQSLWSGYGVIRRARLLGASTEFVVLKHIDISQPQTNRRGWGGEVSHQRKVRSYQIEMTFYEDFSHRCDDACRVPKLVAAKELDNGKGWLIVLEDLDAGGFNQRLEQANPEQIRCCLAWLANFHATFFLDHGAKLWPVGTYWHLETRPEELDKMDASALKDAATRIDQRLNNAKYQTLVHGDAKLANFCFEASPRGRVAAVDFQYVGRSCGMKDVAYFISSCLADHVAEAQEDTLLEHYFLHLQGALKRRVPTVDAEAVEREWRSLYPFCWADFCRFLAGWSPGHWKLNNYSWRQTQRVLNELGDAN